MSKNSSHSSSIRAILFLLNLLISDEWQRDEEKGQTRKDRAETEKWEGGGDGVGAVTLRDWRWMSRKRESSLLLQIGRSYFGCCVSHLSLFSAFSTDLVYFRRTKRHVSMSLTRLAARQHDVQGQDVSAFDAKQGPLQSHSQRDSRDTSPQAWTVQQETTPDIAANVSQHTNSSCGRPEIICQ